MSEQQAKSGNSSTDAVASLIAFAALARGFAPTQPLFEAYTVRNRVYKAENINLDGYTFKNCAFINCVLATTQGNFTLESCHVSLCTVQFSGNALRIVKLSSILLGNWDQLNKSLRPYLEPDGALTIL
ncbi:MAG TPA: hypothetical protein VKM93_13495 [Terriglobia bacterium]|nr:hypothetical protein [Terriglobia bacterium]